MQVVHAALAAAAALVALAFALSTFERWLAHGRRHEAAWTVSLTLFVGGAASLWAGATIGWSEWTFKGFYLFGAILNVPYLALGTVYLLGPSRTGDRWAAAVTVLGAFAAGLVCASEPRAVFDPDVLPQGSDIFGPGPRIAAAVGSGLSATVIFVGAAWSTLRLVRGARRAAPDEPSAQPSVGPLGPGRLALANAVIATGTLVLSASGLANSVLDEMDAFAVTLAVGISVIFAGFLLTATGEQRPDPAPWYPHEVVRRRVDEQRSTLPSGTG